MGTDFVESLGGSSEWRAAITRAINIKRDKTSIDERVGLPELGRISTINTVAYSCALVADGRSNNAGDRLSQKLPIARANLAGM